MIWIQTEKRCYEKITSEITFCFCTLSFAAELFVNIFIVYIILEYDVFWVGVPPIKEGVSVVILLEQTNHSVQGYCIVFVLKTNRGKKTEKQHD